MSAQGRLVLPAAATRQPSAKLRLSCQLPASRAPAPPARTWGLIMPRFLTKFETFGMDSNMIFGKGKSKSKNEVLTWPFDQRATDPICRPNLCFTAMQRASGATCRCFRSTTSLECAATWLQRPPSMPTCSASSRCSARSRGRRSSRGAGGCWAGGCGRWVLVAGAGPVSLPPPPLLPLLPLPNWEVADGTCGGSGPACLRPDSSTGSSAPSCRLWRYGLGLHLIEGEPVPRSSQIDPSEPLSSCCCCCCCCCGRVQQAHAWPKAGGPAGDSSLPLLVCRWPARMHGVAFECVISHVLPHCSCLHLFVAESDHLSFQVCAGAGANCARPSHEASLAADCWQ